MTVFLGSIFVAITALGFTLGPELEKLITAGLQLVTMVLVIAHSQHVRRTLEPKVDSIAAVTTRKLGERKSGRSPAEVTDWDGIERRHPHP